MRPRLDPNLNPSSNPNPNPSHDPSRKLALTLTRTRQHGERGKGCISFAPRQVGWREGDALSVPPTPMPPPMPVPAIYGFPAAARAETPHSSTNTLGRGHRRPHPPHPHDASTSRDQPPHTAGARACASPYLRSGSDMLFVNASNRSCFSDQLSAHFRPNEKFSVGERGRKRRRSEEHGVRRRANSLDDGIPQAHEKEARRASTGASAVPPTRAAHAHRPLRQRPVDSAHHAPALPSVLCGVPSRDRHRLEPPAHGRVPVRLLLVPPPAAPRPGGQVSSSISGSTS